MSAACPDLEQLESYASHRGLVAPPLRDHVSSCADCRLRIAELSDNLSLLNELGSSGLGLRTRLAPARPGPTTVGEFEIVREIGRGGMGVVYEARQRRPVRRVAIKILRGDYSSSEERRRLFDREIHVLARLRHEGIPAIFESGITHDGPYYAMEFVDGVPLSEFLSRNNLDLLGRLRLFLKICSAIGFAHRHGVIHRDLKPANILVQLDGNPKVLDFGLARITGADVTGASMVVEPGRLVGTLAYMSPEQTRGVSDEIDLRSDVYSLGVILFEMLTGSLPYNINPSSIPLSVQAICESAPKRLSEGAGNPELARKMRGDLETIVQKAIEKSPDARYQSASALSEDLERYLADEPIVARPPSAYYQLQKFARRNRVLVAGVVGVAASLGIGFVVAAWQAYRAAAAERRALDESAVNAETNRFLASMFASVDPAADGPTVAVVDVLKRASAELDRSFADQPRVALGLRRAIGTAYRTLTIYPEAEPHFQKGRVLASTIYGPDSREALQFEYWCAEAAAHNGRADEALTALTRAHGVQSSQFGANDPDALTSRQFLGVLNAEAGRLDEAERLYRDAVAGWRIARGLDDDDTIKCIGNLAIVLRMRGNRAEAAALHREAYDASLRLHGPDHAQTITCASLIAMLAETPEETAEIEPMYRDIVERGSRVFGRDHQQTLSFLGGLVMLLEKRCKYEEAETHSRDFLDRLHRARGPRHPDTITALIQRARLLNLAGQPTDALTQGRSAVTAAVDAFGPKDRRTIHAIFSLAVVESRSATPAEALTTIDACLEGFEAVNATGAETGMARAVKADLLRRLGRAAEALPLCEVALKDIRAANMSPILAGFVECVVGCCRRDLGHFAEAEANLIEGRKQMVMGLGECHPSCKDMRDETRQMYEKWHAAEPGRGHDMKAAMWLENSPDLK